VAIFLVGHVNKEGNLAGPRALEHIVDTVLQLEGDEHGQFRILRAVKNRFGSTNELGVFEMTESGMKSVENPSQLFLRERQSNTPGSTVVATVEGARPLLVEVQALCAPSYFTSPRRTVTGADFNRVLVVLAVIEKRLGLRLGDMDVYINVVGGVRVTEPALDLGIALAIISSLRDMPVAPEACVFGEVGLTGEVRAVSHAERRVMEAVRLGFKRCVAPAAVLKNLAPLKDDARLQGASTLRDAVESLLPGALREKGAAGVRAAGRGGRKFKTGDAGGGAESEYAGLPAGEFSEDVTTNGLPNIFTAGGFAARRAASRSQSDEEFADAADEWTEEA
jgi:DNA repair protein RadA/Sms